MALHLWETLNESIMVYTGLSPATFFTVVALGIAIYYVVSGIFGSSSEQHHTGPRDFAEEMQPLPPPVLLGDVTEEELKAASSSSSTLSRWNVFLSFRGKDTRKNFTGHLYSALDRAGIRTFMDDPKLQRGEEISPQLLKAIQESKVSIVVFSENYASSSWCLNELVEILECKRTMEQLVLPVFYNVDPSIVRLRHKKGSFAEAFKSHKKRFRTNKKIVDKWEGALTEAANLSGYDLKNDANGYEAELIEKIVLRVLREVNIVCLNVAKQPVGIESRVEHITPLLSIGTNDILRIGIYGMGGIGKTAIAKDLFNKNYHYFEGNCFLANIRETSEVNNGILRLQEQLLYDILKIKEEVENVDRGISLLKERLRSKKVLIVLDDLDHLSQLDQLAGQWSEFSLGSRIIITTRDVGVLDQIGVEKRYSVEELNDDESLELFSRHAFKNFVPSKDYMEISKGIVRQAGGLPLALEVLGSYLFNRKMIEWRSSLDKLQQIPRYEIQKKLMISYDALGDGNLKDVFLDIACFFIGEDKEMTISILTSCGFNSENEIIILTERCLLSINDENELRMHDLLRDMGREIVYKESPKEPGKRSRLWSSEDIYNVLKKQKGTEAIEGIVIPYEGKLQEVTLNTEKFERMDKLRLFGINNVRLTGNFEHIFEELRWLSWRRCDLQCLPYDFHPEKLVILDLQFSKINILWHGILFLEQLKILNLDGCNFLKTTPDFTGVPNLEKLHLGWCTSLVEIHPSIGHLSKLAFLDFSNCPRLKELPEELGNIESLRELLASRSRIFKIPDSIGRLSRLVNLDLEYCKNLTTDLPNSLCNLRVLKSLCLNGCNNLKRLPIELGNIESLRVLKAGSTTITKLPDSIGRLSRLVDLDLESCRNLRTLPSSLCNLRVLESLNLKNCNNLEELPDSIEWLSRLVDLKLDYCRNLRTLPSSLCNLRVLESLNLNSCNNLEELPEELGNIESLKVLYAGLTAITKLPDSIERLSRLVDLKLDYCRNLRTLPSSLCNLRVLESFNLNNCNNLKELPEELGNIESLKVLNACHTTITKLPDSIGRLSLRGLDLRSCKISHRNLSDNIGSLSSLEWLDLRSCKISDGNLLDNIGSLSSLKKLILSSNIFSTLPSSLGQLSNLEDLDLKYCQSLRSVQKLPPNLKKLSADGCKSMERLPNLSNLKHLNDLDLSDCSRLVEIQGLEKLTSIKSIDLQCCNNLAITFTETFFQVYSGFGKEIEIRLPIRDCPDWFGHQIKGTAICFDVPQNSENKFLGMILWVVSSGLTTLTKVVVENKTNGQSVFRMIGYGHGKGCCSRVRFIPKRQIAVKFGDKIEASIRCASPFLSPDFIIGRFGVHLVYKTDTIENY